MYNTLMGNLELRNISLYSNGKALVEHVSLSISQGECLALAGPSGAGKTTLLRIIAGLRTQDEGEILIDGINVDKVGAGNRNIAMIFQDAALFPHTKVRDNIGYGLRLIGHTTEEINELVGDAAARLGIADLLDRYPDTLSGGEKQRVGIARAIVRKPGILLLDEPFANLDQRLRLQLQQDMMHIQRESNMTMVIVTHDQNEAMLMADKVALLDGGMLEKVGSPAQIYYDPNHLFTASFFGTVPINLMLCECKSNSLSLLGHKITAKLTDGEYVVGIRPADISLDGMYEGRIAACCKWEDRWVAECYTADVSIRMVIAERLFAGDFITFDINTISMLVFTKDGERVRDWC